MSIIYRQQGVALFTVVFLIVVVGLLAVTVGLISGQQQLTSAQTLEQTRALYAARARLEREIAERLDSGDCSGGADSDFAGFSTERVSCEVTDPPIEEGGASYKVFQIEVRASRGDQRSGTLVQRTVQAQVKSD
jgi:MSHA biogenesis protein MshP